MKEKYLKRSFDGNIVNCLTDKGLPRNIAEALSARGINADNFDDYFGDRTVFHSPFEMANMAQAVETISYVMESGGSVLIYGDYDADGLTASSILSLFFSDNGIDNDVIVPTRDEGYGLHADKVFSAFESRFYDLLITVDCGISNADEVKQIIDELGVEVIVTDHHELPEILPECIAVNPKLGYPFPDLSGAGVAWKLVEALAGREVATRYAELATIGTIGDLMPMRDENRSIIKLGLANRNHKSLKKLAELSRCPEVLGSVDIAMKIAPKINASGRVGSPQTALKVLLARDKADVALVNSLLELNELRKKLFDEIVAESDAMCDAKVIEQEKMTFLFNDGWQHGLLGIVASRYKERYNVPSLVMTLDGDNYVGSARSIDGIDLFEAFCECRENLTKFGGHKASVGFSVAKENLDVFRKAISKVFNSYDNSVFDKRVYYDLELGEDCSYVEAMELSDRLQPLLPQDKVMCRIRDSVKFANSFGKDNSHLSCTLASGLELKGFFKFGSYAPLIRDGANVDVICSLETDSYTKNPCGIIEDISLCNSVSFDRFYQLNFFRNFVVNGTCNKVDSLAVKELLQEKSVAVVFDDYETYMKYCEVFDLSEFCVNVFFDDGASRKTVLVSPSDNVDFDKYRNVVVFGQEGVSRKSITNARVFACESANYGLYELEINRDVCAKVFSVLKRKNKFDSLKGVYDKYLSDKISYNQYVVALRIFEELRFIRIVDKYTVEFDSTVKSELSNSSIFGFFQKN